MSASSVVRVAVVGAAAAIVLLAVGTPAQAHVTANPDTAEQGADTATVSFHVPNEQPKGNTTKVEVDLPLNHPLAEVSVRQIPGWTVTVTKAKLPKPVQTNGLNLTEAVSKIVWTGGTIKPDQYEAFDVAMGPLPTNTDALMFTAIQTQSDGTVIKWNQPQPPGAAEPDNPAPTLHLTKAGASASTAPKAASATAASDGDARLIAWLGLVAGVLGIIVGAISLTRGRRTP